MTAYNLINKATQVFFNPVTIVPYPADNPIPQPVIAAQQSFQLSVQGNPGITVSATVQLYVSNDDGPGKNWVPYMDPIAVSGTTKVTAGWGGSQFWKYFSATLPALGGLGAQATLNMYG